MNLLAYVYKRYICANIRQSYLCINLTREHVRLLEQALSSVVEWAEENRILPYIEECKSMTFNALKTTLIKYLYHKSGST